MGKNRFLLIYFKFHCPGDVPHPNSAVETIPPSPILVGKHPRDPEPFSNLKQMGKNRFLIIYFKLQCPGDVLHQNLAMVTIPHRRLRSRHIPGTQGPLQTWNKWVKFDFYSFISSCSVPELFSTQFRPWISFPHLRFRLGNIPGTQGPLQTWNKWVKTDFYLIISSSTAPEMFSTKFGRGNRSPIADFGRGTSPGPRGLCKLEING